ncbi:MAG: hypothetical protein NT005_10990 [Spirochaetes bacterium]|nr:hypothetical protein [Spirochaetota bacterium]
MTSRTKDYLWIMSRAPCLSLGARARLHADHGKGNRRLPGDPSPVGRRLRGDGREPPREQLCRPGFLARDGLAATDEKARFWLRVSDGRYLRLEVPGFLGQDAASTVEISEDSDW